MVDYTEAGLDLVFGAVADRTRRSFLRRLSEREASISELARPLTMSLEAASKHVRVLERAGLVRRHRAGRSFVVRLRAEAMRDAAAWMEYYRAFWTRKLDDLAAYVESGETPAPVTGATKRNKDHGKRQQRRG